MFACAGLALVASFLMMSCQNDSMVSPGTGMQTKLPSAAPHQNSSVTTTANTKGAGGEMPAYYDSVQFTINLSELPSAAEQATLAKNGSINHIYMSDQLLPGGMMFVAVLDAIQKDGFNPLWQEVDVTFNAGVTPFQLFEDNDVVAASMGPSATITLTNTTQVYRCAVVGPK
jgi:hypothetical protein